MRAKEAERVLLGSKVEETLVREAARCASEESRPISDIRGSEAYRRVMVDVMTQRAIEESLVSARKSASG
jgi:carbon-monoxide dehydrogenase medium subunit